MTEPIKLYKKLRKLRDAVDDLMLEVLEDVPYKEAERDVIAVGKSKEQQERIKSILDIIRELEREAGSAHIDTIVERASKLGFEKDIVEAEIVRLVQEAAIFEPVRYSRNYRTSQQ
jgi:DNA replicative helicase MCM subunit Mcm2 (Cdc46/Mcm family)